MMATLRRSLRDTLDARTGIPSAWASRSIPLRAWLFMLSMVAMLPIMVFSGYTVMEQAREAQAQLLTGLKARAADAARIVDQALQKNVALINVLAEDPALSKGDFEKLHARAQRLVQSQPQLRNITLADAGDHVVFWTYHPYGTPGLRVHELPSLHQARKSGLPTLSRALFPPVGGPPVFLLSVPVLRGGQVSHVLRAAVRVDAIEQLLADLQMPEGWVAGIAESGGRLIARSRLSEQFMDKPASPEFIAAIQRRDPMPFKAITVDGVVGTSAAAPVFGGNWYLAIGVSDEVLLAPLKATMAKLVVLGLVWLMLGLALARWLSNHLARQARQLVTEIHAQTGAGDPAKLSVTEFRQLMVDSQALRQEMSDVRQELSSAQAERDEVYQMYDQAPCGHHALDASGRVVRMNQTALSWLGYGLDEVLGRRFTDFMTPAGKATFAASFPGFIAGGEVSDLTLEFLRKDGSAFKALLNATSVRDSAGQHLFSRSTLVPLRMASTVPTLVRA